MNFKFAQIQKGKLILEALYNYGILDRQTLQYIIPTFNNKRNLLRTLKILCNKGLVVRRYKKVISGKSIFYQLNQNLEARKALATYLGGHANDFLQEEYRYSELFHELTLAKISYHLQAKYPQGLIIREKKIMHHPRAQKVFLGANDIKTPKPDILFILKIPEREKIILAIEYERTGKSKKRLAEKLKFYAQKSALDGIIYFYDDDRIDHNLHETFLDRILDHSYRIKKYGHNFLVTSCIKNDVEKSFNQLINRDKNHYSLDHYINVLTSCSAHNRTDENFKTPPL